MAATDARPLPLKSTAYRVTFPILDADGDLVTGAAGLDSEVSIDGGTFADCTNEATEIATSSGMYFLDLTAGEMSGDTIALIVKTSTVGAKTTPIVLYPSSPGRYPVNVEADGIVAASIATDAITAAKIAANAIGSSELADGAITNAKLADGAISAAKIVDGALTAAKFAAGAFDAVWTVATRTLTSFGTLVSDVAAAVWNATLASFQTLGSTGAALADASGDTTICDANLIQIDGSADDVARLKRSIKGIVLGTVASGASTTSIPVSSLDPASAVAGQFNGRVVIFPETTTTVELRGCAATIEASALDGTLTLLAAEALPVSPGSGDTFVIN